MQVVYLNGRRLQLTWREVQGQFRHPLFVGMMLMMACCIILIAPYDHLLGFAALRLTLFYAACFGSFSGLLYLAFYLCHRWNWRAFSLFTVGFAGLGATLCGLIAAMLLGAPVPSVMDMVLVTGFNLVFCYLGETLQSTFIIPRVLADLRGRATRDVLAEFLASESGAVGPEGRARPAESPPPSVTEPTLPRGPQPPVTIFGQSFAPATIYLLEAEEHYVAITLQDGARLLLRGRIADAVAVLPPHLGRQVHRSYWVCAAAVAGLRPEKSGALLVLTNGRTVPVARPRLAETRSWVAATLGRSVNKKAPLRVPSAN